MNSDTQVTPERLNALRHLPLRDRMQNPLFWTWLRFMVFGRAIPAAIFGFLAYINLRIVINIASGFPHYQRFDALLGDFLPPLLYLCFCALPVGIYLGRAMPLNRDARLLPRAAAFIGTTMQLLIGLLFPIGPLLFGLPWWVQDLSTPLTVFALIFAIVSLSYLRRNLSIIPEARRLVTAGPYRLVRHPMYFAEISAALAIVLHRPALIPLLSFTAFVMVQLSRARFEESLLRQTFPEYANYSLKTKLVIPFLL